jgi:predicted site-specific integrase-resolvase
MQDVVDRDKVLTIYQVAELAGVHWQTVRRWWNRGNIKPLDRLNDRDTVFFDRSEIEKFLKTRGI